MEQEQYDFVVIGAGLSGIDAAYRLKTTLPECTYTILEARDRIGGTWSFFNYPGIRADSALTVFGLPWRPHIGSYHVLDTTPMTSHSTRRFQALVISREW